MAEATTETGMIVILFVAAALVVIALIAILNTLTFPRLRCAALTQPLPRVSVLIPARNEAAVIGTTVRALLSQSGVEFELLVLDDHSSDGTPAAVQAAAAGDPRLQVIVGADLPAGWLGKNWACHQLAEAASAPILIFTDADVRWEPGALAALVAELERSRA
ncbi:MAG: glycosyltransferase family 2 protein, partial [Aggregatilineales bacterium]